MGSIVLELQQEIISQECDIVNALRKAHLIAVKLSLEDFDKWICNELNGYSSQSTCPDYRKIHCVLRGFNPYHGWIPTVINDPESEKNLSEKCIIQSISEIITLIENSKDGLIINCSGAELEMFNKMFDNPVPMQFAYHVSTASVADIIEKVKNALLEWTLQLEKEGIIGENMAFNEKEKEQAKSIPQTINNYYGNTNVVNGSAENSQIISGNNNSITISMEELRSKLDRFEEEVRKDDNLSQEDIDTALELLSDIRDKINSDKKPSIIKSGLVGLKDFLITAGGGLAANLLAALITQL